VKLPRYLPTYIGRYLARVGGACRLVYERRIRFLVKNPRHIVIDLEDKISHEKCIDRYHLLYYQKRKQQAHWSNAGVL